MGEKKSLFKKVHVELLTPISPVEVPKKGWILFEQHFAFTILRSFEKNIDFLSYLRALGGKHHAKVTSKHPRFNILINSLG